MLLNGRRSPAKPTEPYKVLMALAPYFLASLFLLAGFLVWRYFERQQQQTLQHFGH